MFYPICRIMVLHRLNYLIVSRTSLRFDVIYLQYYVLPHPYYHGTPLPYLAVAISTGALADMNFLRSPPLRYSITKNKLSCRGKKH